MAFVVYKIVCNKNGKMYIGSTIHKLSVRWKQHLLNVKHKKHLPLYTDILKHGQDAFEVSIISYCKNSDEMSRKEKKNIVSRNTTIPFGYNIKMGGYKVSGHKALSNRVLLTEENRIKINAALGTDF